jgi:sugar phosphate isomerase/epimerase
MTMSAYPFTIACCSIALRNKPIAEALEQIAAAGFRAVEILYPHVEKLDADGRRAVADQCRKLGVTPIVLAPYFSFTRGDEWVQRSLQTAREALEIAAVLGVKKIRTFVDIGPDGLPSARATEADWRAACAGLKELCALDPATEFVIETHENTLANTLPTVQRLLAEVDRPNLKINFQLTTDFAERGYMKCLETHFPHVTHMHWDQVRDDMSGTYIDEPGRIDFAELIAWLVAKGYRGTASVEYCWNPIDEERLPSAVRFLDGVMEKLGRPSAA